MTGATTSSRSYDAQEKKFIEQTIIQFVKGTANRDVYNMNYILDENFQAVISTLGPLTISKSDYMKMLGQKNLGGVELDVEMMSMEISEYAAAAKVKITSNGITHFAFYHLYLESNGSWQMLHVLA